MSFLLRLLHGVPLLLTGLVQLLLPCTAYSSTPIDPSSEGPVISDHPVHLQEESGLQRDRGPVTIDVLPDDVLLEIIDFYEYVNDLEWYTRRNTWHALVHVCRRWRYLVFASPRHLDLRLVYRGHGPMSEVLDAWPILPVSLILFKPDPSWWRDNLAAALESEHSNRICQIIIPDLSNLHWERFAAAMQKPFPELTHMEVWMPEVVRVLPNSFLGGSTPRLRSLVLGGIPFPSIPKLLLSANHLVRLKLWNIPDFGYISPDEMVTALTVMTRLEFFGLGFLSPRSRPDPASRPPPPPTQFVLTTLAHLEFKGVYEYLEDLLARIDGPHLDNLYIEFFMDLYFYVPQFHRLITYVEEFKTFNHANLWIDNHSIQLYLYPNTQEVDRHRRLELRINCSELNYQLLSPAQVCSSLASFPLISALEDLRIIEDDSLSSSHWKDDMENTQWLELLGPFTALKDLYLTSGIAQRFCGSLQELSEERTTEVLPTLCNLFVQGSSLKAVQEAMKPFVAARQLSGHPVIVDNWNF